MSHTNMSHTGMFLTRYAEEVHAIYMVTFQGGDRFAYYAMPVMAWTDGDGIAAIAAPDGRLIEARVMPKVLFAAHSSILSEVRLVAVDRLSRWEKCPHLLPPYRLIPGIEDVGTYDPARHDRR